MQQFFIENISNPILSAAQLHQVRKVLRMRIGDQIRCVDVNGKGAVFSFANSELSQLSFVEPINFPKKKVRICLIASLIRTERLEWMIQKACECGCDEIVLFAAEHGVVRDFGTRSDRKIARLNLIAREACEQSYRQFPVSVTLLNHYEELLSYQSDATVYADLGNHKHLLHTLGSKPSSVSVIVGPEGGFSDSERSFFQSHGIVPVSLGKYVYRAETASIAALNILSILEI